MKFSGTKYFSLNMTTAVSGNTEIEACLCQQTLNF